MKNRRLKVLYLLLFLLTCIGTAGAESGSHNPESSSDTLKKVTFIELGSVKCIPCQAMVSVMEQMEKELGDQVNVFFHDVWTEEGKPYVQEYRIRVIPTQIFLDQDGNEYYRHEGYYPVEELYPVLEQGGVELP